MQNNSLLKSKYWNLEVKEHSTTVKKASKTIRKLIEISVQDQLISEVPVGVFLSGGIDSSIVVAESSKAVEGISTYSIGFESEKFDETKYAKKVSQTFVTNYRELTMYEACTNDLYKNIAVWYDEPFSDTSAFSTYLVSKFAKEEVTVVLTGDGGDEIFGGYSWYSAFKRLRPFHLRLPKRIKKYFLNRSIKNKKSLFGRVLNRFRYLLLNDFELHTTLMSGLLKEQKVKYAKKFNICDDYDDYWYFRKYYRKELKLLTRLQYLDFHTYLPDDILTKVDRVSMAVSLEARVPLLSTELVEYMFSIPEKVRYSNGELKGLIKSAYKGILPKEIIARGKKGFDIPIDSWNSLFDNSYDSTQEKILNDLFSDRF